MMLVIERQLWLFACNAPDIFSLSARDSMKYEPQCVVLCYYVSAATAPLVEIDADSFVLDGDPFNSIFESAMCFKLSRLRMII